MIICIELKEEKFGQELGWAMNPVDHPYGGGNH